MNDQEVLLDDALLLVEQNFYFLHMGEFFGKLSKTEDFTDRSLFVVKKYENEKAYYFTQALNGVFVRQAIIAHILNLK